MEREEMIVVVEVGDMTAAPLNVLELSLDQDHLYIRLPGSMAFQGCKYVNE